jgi:tetratricopeptide (TPR) repeat protein
MVQPIKQGSKRPLTPIPFKRRAIVTFLLSGAKAPPSAHVTLSLIQVTLSLIQVTLPLAALLAVSLLAAAMDQVLAGQALAQPSAQGTPSTNPPAHDPNDITQLTLGRAAFDARDFNRALQAFYRFSTQRPNNLAVHFWLATTLSALGRDQEAQKEYASCLQLSASIGLDSAEMRTDLGNNLIRQGLIKEPMFDYKRAITIDPRSPSPYLGLAKCLIETGNFDEALSALSSYQKAGGQDINAILLHGLALAGKDQYGPAKQDLSNFLNAAQNGGYNQPLDQDRSSWREKYVTTGSANQGAIDLARRMLNEIQQRN